MTSTLILISGPPGVGKSTLAQEVARQIQAFILDKDCVDEPFSPHDRGPHYTQEIEPKVLQALLNLAKLNLELAKNVILDLPWSHIMLNTPHWAQKVKELCQSVGCKLKVIELGVEEKELYQRIQQRGLKRDHSKLTAKGWEIFKKSDRLGERIPLDHLYIEARAPLASYLDQVLEYLND